MEIEGLLSEANFSLSSIEGEDENDFLTKTRITTPVKHSPQLQGVVSIARGRGRPPKNGVAAAVTKIPVVYEPRGRGRPAKRGKSRITQPILPTGKGRGRPKKQINSDSDSDDSSDEATSSRAPPAVVAAKPGKKRGRPRKVKNSDDDSDDDYERQPVGRPATGAINLNIERTGRGQGRPKKSPNKPKTSYSGALGDDGGDDDDNNAPDPGIILSPKRKRGRPSKGGAPAPKTPTGRPRGRPKTKVEHVQSSSSDDDDDEDDEENDYNSMDAINKVNLDNGQDPMMLIV